MWYYKMSAYYYYYYLQCFYFDLEAQSNFNVKVNSRNVNMSMYNQLVRQ